MTAERVVRALEALEMGREVRQTGLHKHRVLSRIGTDEFFFVGRQGGLRVGKTFNSSISITHNVLRLIALAENTTVDVVQSTSRTPINSIR